MILGTVVAVQDVQPALTAEISQLRFGRFFPRRPRSTNCPRLPRPGCQFTSSAFQKSPIEALINMRPILADLARHGLLLRTRHLKALQDLLGAADNSLCGVLDELAEAV